MICKELDRDLVAFHFGALSEDERAAHEAHLLICRECLRSFLALKRDIEVAAESAEVPSPRARSRLRNVVAAKLERRVPRSRWEMPLSFGFASAAVVFAIVATGLLATTEGAPPRGVLSAQGR